MLQNKIASLACACALITIPLSVHSETMLGAYIKHDGWSVVDLNKFNTDTTKPMAIVTLFSTFDNNWDSLTIQASNIVATGAMPVISWMPYSAASGDVLADIIAGNQDSYINDWIAGFSAWRDSYPATEKPTVLLRFAHEFNGNWYPWANQPEKLKQAWRHLHALFEAAGVNNGVEWVWCINNASVDDYNDITRYYPGGDVVDWTAIDGYNWGSNYSFSSWTSFDETFSSAYVNLQTHYPGKPVLIAEVGSAEPDDLPNPAWGQDGSDADANQSKEAWVDDMYSRIITNYPAIRAVSWFNINKELSWALNETARSGLPNTGLNAYNSVIPDNHYTGDFTPLSTAKQSTAKQSGGKSNANHGKQSSKGGQLKGLSRALAVSHMPQVVGQKLLARQAQGFRNLPIEVLTKIRDSRINP